MTAEAPEEDEEEIQVVTVSPPAIREASVDASVVAVSSKLHLQLKHVFALVLIGFGKSLVELSDALQLASWWWHACNITPRTHREPLSVASRLK